MRRSIARCSRAVDSGCLSTASIAIWKYSVASRNADLANAFLAARCPYRSALHPVLGLDRMMAKRFRDVFLAPGEIRFQSRQNPAVQHFPLRAEDRIVGDLANEIVGKDILHRRRADRASSRKSRISSDQSRLCNCAAGMPVTAASRCGEIRGPRTEASCRSALSSFDRRSMRDAITP